MSLLDQIPQQVAIEQAKPQKDPGLYDYTDKVELDPEHLDNISKALLGTKLAATLVDMAQTRHIARNTEDSPARGKSYYEKDAAWAIGKKPHQDAVAAYMLGNALLDLAAAKYLPNDWVKAFLGVRLMDTLNALKNNKAIGIKPRM
jgi:hypothetical protein